MNEVRQDVHRAVLRADKAFRNYLEGEGYDPTFFRLILTAERSTDIDYEAVYRLNVDFNPQDEIPPFRYNEDGLEIFNEE